MKHAVGNFAQAQSAPKGLRKWMVPVPTFVRNFTLKLLDKTEVTTGVILLLYETK